jgi:hypothetical protein
MPALPIRLLASNGTINNLLAFSTSFWGFQNAKTTSAFSACINIQRSKQILEQKKLRMSRALFQHRIFDNDFRFPKQKT